MMNLTQACAVVAQQRPADSLLVATMGAMFAFDLTSADDVEKVVKYCLENGMLTFWFLSHPYSFRLSPPLNLGQEDWDLAAKVIISALDRL